MTSPPAIPRFHHAALENESLLPLPGERQLQPSKGTFQDTRAEPRVQTKISMTTSARNGPGSRRSNATAVRNAQETGLGHLRSKTVRSRASFVLATHHEVGVIQSNKDRLQDKRKRIGTELIMRGQVEPTARNIDGNAPGWRRKARGFGLGKHVRRPAWADQHRQAFHERASSKRVGNSRATGGQGNRYSPVRDLLFPLSRPKGNRDISLAFTIEAAASSVTESISPVWYRLSLSNAAFGHRKSIYFLRQDVLPATCKSLGLEIISTTGIGMDLLARSGRELGGRDDAEWGEWEPGRLR
ncbi:hypothetical protein BS17DRAFT_764352 [Gyrodon lividus]|nr:hypothetical protein BS17DRAFT_764352 [Gyrodon lividus]